MTDRNTEHHYASKASPLIRFLGHPAFKDGHRDAREGNWNPGDWERNDWSMKLYEMGRYWAALGGPKKFVSKCGKRATPTAWRFWHDNWDVEARCFHFFPPTSGGTDATVAGGSRRRLPDASVAWVVRRPG